MPLLDNHFEKLSDLKELYALYEELITLDLPDGHDLLDQHQALEAQHFRCLHSLKKLLGTSTSRSARLPATGTCKLPKLEVPLMATSCVGTSSGNSLRYLFIVKAAFPMRRS